MINSITWNFIAISRFEAMIDKVMIHLNDEQIQDIKNDISFF